MDLYLYFDEDGALVEHKQFGEARSGSSGTDNIYIYDKSELADASCSIAYEKSNGDTLEVLATKVYDVELPTDDEDAVSNANLTSFAFYKTYSFMYKYTLFDTDLSDTEFLKLLVRIFSDDDEDGTVDSGELVYAKGIYILPVENGVMINEESLTLSQYDYLIYYVSNSITEVENLVDGKVNYTDFASFNYDIVPLSDVSGYLGTSAKRFDEIHAYDGYFNKIDLNHVDLATTLTTMSTATNTNATDIATNAANISTNTANIATNASGIATNVTDISNIVNGTTVVAEATKATLDSNGDNIHDNAVSLQNDIDRLRGIARSYGSVDYNTEDVTDAILTAHVVDIKGDNPSNGDLVYDLDNHEWEYNGTSWVDNGEWEKTSIATDTELGVVKASNDVSVNATTGAMTVNNSEKLGGIPGGIGIGTNSTRLGINTKALGRGSFAGGYNATARYDNTTALGNYATGDAIRGSSYGHVARSEAIDSNAFGAYSISNVEKMTSFDGLDGSNNPVNRHVWLKSPEYLFFRNEDVDSSKTTLDDYTNGRSLQDYFDDKVNYSDIENMVEYSFENLVINGDFSDGINGWTISISSTWSIANNVLEFISTVKYASIRQYFDLTAGKTYLFGYKFKSASSNSLVQLYDMTNSTMLLSTNYTGNTDFEQGYIEHTATEDINARLNFSNGSEDFLPIYIKEVWSYDITDYVNAGMSDDEIKSMISNKNNPIQDLYETNSRRANDIYPVSSIGLYTNFGVIGDSYASGGIYDASGQGYDNYWVSWGQQLARLVGNTCYNFSKGGLTTRTWLTNENGLSLMKSSPALEMYIIALGINDAHKLGTAYLGTIDDINDTDYTLNADSFYGNYGRIISEIKLRSPNAKIIMTSIAAKVINYTEFNNAIIAIASHFGIPYINLQDDYFFTSEAFYSQNSGHPTANDYAGYARAMDRLYAKCSLEYEDYFDYYIGNGNDYQKNNLLNQDTEEITVDFSDVVAGTNAYFEYNSTTLVMKPKPNVDFSNKHFTFNNVEPSQNYTVYVEPNGTQPVNVTINHETVFATYHYTIYIRNYNNVDRMRLIESGGSLSRYESGPLSTTEEFRVSFNVNSNDIIHSSLIV